MQRPILAQTVFACGILLAGCSVRQMIYPLPGIPVPAPPPPLEEVVLALHGGDEVTAWHDPGAALPRARPAVLFFHGNGENLETLRRSGLLDRLAGLDIAFLAVDYPGYGRSSGRPSEGANVEAAHAALDWLRSRHPERPLVAAGWSLGAAVAIALAAERRDMLGGVVAMSPWSSLPGVAERHFPVWLVRLLLRERYDSLAVAPRIDLPALVLHGTLDRIIPVEHGRRVALALAGSRWVEVDGAGHNDLLFTEVVWRELRSFLNRMPAAG